MVGTNSDLLVVLVIDSENGEKYSSQNWKIVQRLSGSFLLVFWCSIS